MENLPNKSFKLNFAECCICRSDDAVPIGLGQDFEYRTSSDTFLAMQCNSCGLVYLNPRPDVSEFETIYPPTYHAFDFSEKDFGIVYKIRSRLEAQRVLSWCKDLPDDARILDIGCGDGFHLNLLREYGKKGWTLEGVDVDKRAVDMAHKKGLTVHLGSIETVDLPNDAYDLAFMVQTVEHVENPAEILSAIKEVLKPNGKLVIVTDNTDSLDFGFFKGSYWGGYHFPRHLNLFNRNSLSKLAQKVGFEVVGLTTVVSPVNWVYSIRNALVDWNAPKFLVNQFSLKTTISLSVFTLLDIVFQKLSRGALMRAILRKPLFLSSHLIVRNSMKNNKKPIAIIGAGLAGLTAANYLQHKNISFVLFESGKKIAGLAASFADAEGFSYDFGAHFVTNRLAAAIGVSSDCVLVKHYGETVWLGRKVYGYPFGLIRIPRMTLSAVKSKLEGKSHAPKSAAEWFRNSYGNVLADEVALP